MVSLSLLLIPMGCYLLESAFCLKRGDYAGAITFAAYGVANIGLIWKFLYS